MRPPRPRLHLKHRTVGVAPVVAVILRGPLGVGKSTVAERLASRLGGNRVSIDTLLERYALEEWASDRIALESFLRANDHAVREARRLARLGRSVVIEGNFYWREALADLARRLEIRPYVFRLAAPVAVCIARDRRRPAPRDPASPRAGERMGRKAVQDVYRLASGVRAGIPVDARGPVDRVVGRILRRLPRGARPPLSWKGTPRGSARPSAAVRLRRSVRAEGRGD